MVESSMLLWACLKEVSTYDLNTTQIVFYYVA